MFAQVNTIKTRRVWWEQLDDKWKQIFKKTIYLENEPTDSELAEIVNLSELNCSFNHISDLQPLYALTNLQKLDCNFNNISDLEPIHALTNLQELYCGSNQISNYAL